MSVNNALFRSQLMQQFAAAARGQSRPPLALLSSTSQKSGNCLVGTSWQTNNNNNNNKSSSSSSGFSSVPNSSNNKSQSLSPAPLVVNNNASPPPIKKNDISDTNINNNQEDEDSNSSELAKNFQSMIMSRRTVSRFQQPPSPSPLHDEKKEWIQSAIERAVTCAMTAPNHYRTEPVTCKRFTNESNTAKQLLDICFQVAMQRQNSIDGAQQKRDKWEQISSFVVVTVGQQPCQITKIPPNNTDNTDDNDPYETLPFHPPQTERQLEDYAAASASIQNLLLSLHSEGLGSKWATGPIIRCRAFRDLIQCHDDEFIVGLIMIGESLSNGNNNSSRSSSSQSGPSRRKMRRLFTDDLLQDLD